MAAVLEWCRICRPDILPKVEQMIGGSGSGNDGFDGLTMLLAIGFDAGRCFQRTNPGCPLGPIVPGGNWDSITETVFESRGETSPVPERSCDCGHTRDQHDERGSCDGCECSGFVPV